MAELAARRAPGRGRRRSARRGRPGRSVSPGPVPAELGDLAAGADEAAQRGHLADDPRVVAALAVAGTSARQLVDADAAADGLELASLLELVDDRDRVDRLALRVEPERGAVDLRVALAVEVARVEDLADRADGAGREHHRAEDGLLGVEVLRRDGRGGRGRGVRAAVRHQAMSNRSMAAAGGQAPGSTRGRALCRHNGTYVRHVAAGRPTVGQIARCVDELRSERELLGAIHTACGQRCGRASARAARAASARPARGRRSASRRLDRLGLGQRPRARRSAVAPPRRSRRRARLVDRAALLGRDLARPRPRAPRRPPPRPRAACGRRARRPPSASSSSSGGSSPPSGTTSVLHLDGHVLEDLDRRSRSGRSA